MKHINNKDAAKYVEAKKAFKGSNLTGEWTGNVYIVRSYNAILFAFFLDKKMWMINNAKYSKTTSRHYNSLIKIALYSPCLTFSTSEDDMNENVDNALNNFYGMPPLSSISWTEVTA